MVRTQDVRGLRWQGLGSLGFRVESLGFMNPTLHPAYSPSPEEDPKLLDHIGICLSLFWGGGNTFGCNIIRAEAGFSRRGYAMAFRVQD